MDKETGKRNASANFKSRSRVLDPTVQLGKLPPQAIELEEAVLGALLIDKDALMKIVDMIKIDSFYKDAHRHIFEAILDIYNSGETVIDILTVSNQLRKNAKLDLSGGMLYLVELSNKVNSAANIEYHARIVLEMAIKRDLISIAGDIETRAFEDSTDVFELLDGAEQKIFQISENNLRSNSKAMTDLVRAAVENIEVRSKQTSGITGVPSGFSALDRVTAGWQKSDLVIIAARPGMGKTAFVVSCMRNAAVKFQKPVAIFSLEMSALQLVDRMISSEAELESEKIKRGTLADFEWTQLSQKVPILSEAPVYIDDTPGLSILELRAKARRLKAEKDISMIIIDYLQLMSADMGKGGQGNREQEISAISRGLKKLAKELEVPVLALSQLSRSVETRGGDKRPMLSDLRESGAIEQDADMVVFLYRPEYYGITEDEDGMPVTNTAEVIIAKHRNGSLETVPLKFIGKFTKFMDIDSDFDTNSSFGTGNSFPTINSSNFEMGSGSVTIPSKMNDAEGENSTEVGPEDDNPPF